jgi:hypothetical protein
MNDFTEADVRAAIADWRKQYRKQTVYKAIGWMCLTILICGGCLGVLYAFSM